MLRPPPSALVCPSVTDTSASPAAEAPSAAPARRAHERGAPPPTTRPPRPDRALHLLLLAAEREARVGVTVSAGGVTVSGRLVSTRAFGRALADQFTTLGGVTDLDPAIADALRALVDDAVDVAQGDRRAAPDAEAYEHATAFVHLAEARVVSGAGLLPAGRHGVLWRCRACDVHGWALGELVAG